MLPAKQMLINFNLLQALIIKDLLENNRVQGFFAAHDKHASDNAIVGVLGTETLSAAREIIKKNCDKQCGMLFDLSDIHHNCSIPMSIELIEELRISKSYIEIYQLFVGKFN